MSVAIVGQAWRTSLGRTIDGAIDQLLAGKRAAIASPRAAGYASSVVAPITDEPAKSRSARFLRRMGLFGLEVAQEAFAAANLGLDGDRIGLFAGVGGLRAHWDDMLKALANQSEDGANAWERGLRDVHPYWMLRHLSNNVHALAAMELGLRGEGATYGGATGGAQAIAAAGRALMAGAIDAALVVAYDSLLEPETLVELGARRAATLETEPSRIAPAYDARAAGCIPGEAAGALVLVRIDGAPEALRVIATDGADGEREEPSPHAIARTLRSLLSRGDALAAIDGAARAWPDRDAAERAVLGDLIASTTPLTAITSSFGQLGAATSVIQTIALGALLRAGRLPAIAGLGEPAPGALVPVTATRSIGRAAIDGRVAIGLSSGAPGLCAAVRVERPA